MGQTGLDAQKGADIARDRQVQLDVEYPKTTIAA